MPQFDCEIEDLGKDTIYPPDPELDEMKENISKNGWVFNRKIGNPESKPIIYEFTRGEQNRFVWNGAAGLSDYII